MSNGSNYPRAKSIFIRRPASIFLYPVLKKVNPYLNSTVTWDGLYNLQQLIADIDAKKINGDLVEAGGWRGGCGVFMAWASKKSESYRRTWLLDTYDTEPEEILEHPLNFFNEAKPFAWLESEDPPQESPRYLAAVLDVEHQIKVVKGMPEDTIPLFKKRIGNISLLFLNNHDYDLLYFLLSNFYELVSEGGYVVINDYAYEPARRALYDFFRDHGLAPQLHAADARAGAYFEKN